MTGFQVGSEPCSCGRFFHDTRLIAVTGGPGAGKTAVLERIVRSLCEHVGVLPEAASVVFGGGFPRKDSAVARCAAQRAIYHVQREVEALVTGEGKIAVALCDRGTLDGVAYWPGDEDSLWRQVGTTRKRELRRYAAVIHLQTPAREQGYNRDNTLRVESPAEAQALDRRILDAWGGHPCRVIVASIEDFHDKAAVAVERVRAELPSCCRAHPMR
ncbi:MAG: ATP-binding protein [Myxococcota bacterium]